MIKLVIPGNPLSVNHLYCEYCGIELKARQTVACGSKECQTKRIKDWHESHKNLEYVKERKRVNQRKYASNPIVKEKYSYKNNKDYFKEYAKNKRKTNLKAIITERIRDRFRKAIKKNKHTTLYGINIQDIINHLGPCPGNITEYHIDHIKPLDSFDLQLESEIQKAFAPTNHQWLLGSENLRKSNKI